MVLTSLLLVTSTYHVKQQQEYSRNTQTKISKESVMTLKNVILVPIPSSKEAAAPPTKTKSKLVKKLSNKLRKQNHSVNLST